MALKKKQAIALQRGLKTVGMQSVNGQSPVTQQLNAASVNFISSGEQQRPVSQYATVMRPSSSQGLHLKRRGEMKMQQSDNTAHHSTSLDIQGLDPMTGKPAHQSQLVGIDNYVS